MEGLEITVSKVKRLETLLGSTDKIIQMGSQIRVRIVRGSHDKNELPQGPP